MDMYADDAKSVEQNVSDDWCREMQRLGEDGVV